jgi:hypothetical protein
MNNVNILQPESPVNVAEHRQVEVITAGANRGARQMQPAIETFNRTSERFTIAPVYVDPVPQRAMQLVRSAHGCGIPAKAIEGRLDEVLATPRINLMPIIISVDNAASIASALDVIDLNVRPVLIYFLVRLPNEQLLGLRAVLQRGDEDVQRLAAEFFKSLAFVTARSGASAVLGADGRPAHIQLEAVYRAWFAQHMHANVPKIIAGTRPETDPIEVTLDGRTTMTLMLQDATAGWSDPSTLARHVVDEPSSPISRGRDFAVAEIGRDGIRLHIVRLRATDGKPAIGAAAVVDVDAYRAADAERRERARRELLAAVERAERETISRRRPIFTTD